MTTTEMREPTLLVLTALTGGRAHGYALLTEAINISGGRVRLKVGTLYAILDRLLEQGLVQEAGEEIVDGRLRKYFELTTDGGAALAEEIERLEANAKAARQRLQTWRPSPTLGTIAPAIGVFA